jgi:hypothetical protein
MKKRIVEMTLVGATEGGIPSEESIRDTVDRLCSVFAVDAQIKEQILSEVFARCLVRMDSGYALAENHSPWVNARKPEIDPYYWDRYKLLLQKNWAPNVITALDRTTDDILDLMGNPNDTTTWKRRGLVMGDVQSGKTATYSALICKAADAGYRFVVLLTGTIENLRRQTQERLDSSFVGFDSGEQLKRDGSNIYVGVGELNQQRMATVFTSTQSDFAAKTLQILGLSLNALKEPALVVIKKHPKILKNLRDWLSSYNMTIGNNKIDIPMLLIDDEADNASINTNNAGADPTAVNNGIRELLSLFRRTTYVGFTATPFANIFVNPDSQEEMLGDDLFPQDFIYTLQPPSNYFGPQRIFLDDTGSELHLRQIIDLEDAIPATHNSNYTVTNLPDSLKESIRVFLVANAIRDLRGDIKNHRSMLVNVSQFTKVQNQVETLVHSELELYKTAIRNNSALPPVNALKDSRLLALQETWRKEYANCGFDWQAIQPALHNAVLPISTKAVNQNTGPGALDYKKHAKTGLRIIAIGGNSLSRGLTLEGLTVSYFRRTTQMYDTLLQMGRWFGYRTGYEDLCRVMLPAEAIDWYGHISEATDELRAELKRMHHLGMTPKEFGLVVRAHPDSLMVTARNKMQSTAEITRVISLSNQSFESVELPYKTELIENNFRCVEAFLTSLRNRLGNFEPPSGQQLFRGAKRTEISQLLRGFVVPPTEFRFQPQDIADLLDNLTGDDLDSWDVFIPTGDGEQREIGGINLLSQVRAMRLEAPPGILVVSGDKRRVGSRGVEKAGLTIEQLETAYQNAKNAAEQETSTTGKKLPEKINVADRFYRAVRTRPLLIIHILDAKPIKGQSWTLPENSKDKLVAIGLSFPALENETATREVKYKINLVKARQIFPSLMDAQDDEDLLENYQ